MTQRMVDKLFEALPIKPVTMRFWVVVRGKPHKVDELPFKNTDEALFFLKKNKFKPQQGVRSYFETDVLDDKVYMHKEKKLGIQYATLHA